ncbi:MAG: recombinase RecT [Armatimonadia bacterium]
MNDQTTKSENPLVVLNDQLEKRAPQFQAALPAHIPVERFKRVVLTAIQQNPKLATADRPSLFTSAMKAAQDGLLPDGREGALVIYNTKVKINGAEKWIDAVQWMPMIAGIRKKVRNSKEIATWDAKVVYEKDEFIYEDGLDLILKHRPYLDGDPGPVRVAYSVAKLKTGEVSVEVMTKHQIDRIRQLSKSKDKGPWVDHYAEMAKKTVARRHSKVLPMSTDLDDLIRRDDALYDMEGASDKANNAAARRPQLSDFSEVESSRPTDTKPGAAQEPARIEAQPEQADVPHDAETGEVAESQEDTPEPSPADAYKLGQEARDKGKALKAVPPEFRESPMQAYADAWQEGWRARDEELAPQKK